MRSTVFDKYERMGAYHWRECDPSSRDYNPPLAARYAMISKRIFGKDILDLGAGDGYLAGVVASGSRRVYALESEQSGVDIARLMLAKFDNVEVVQGSAYEIPFPSESFDCVMMADVIEHLESPVVAVREMARVLRNDGLVLVTTPQWRSDRVWDERHVKEYKPDELISLMSTAFGSVEMRYGWPRRWSDLYRSRIGWRMLKWIGRVGINPFLTESDRPEGFCQMLALARQPLKREVC